jgi:5-methyltetrahydrofolate--homocysteine methyltransferase
MKEATSLPIIAQPNAGRPKFVAGRTFFDMTPSDFAEGIRMCINEGARYVGGCCGTSPDHIKALIRLVGQEAQG